MSICGRGDVIRIQAKKRIGEKDFIETIRQALTDYYKPQNKTVGMGGIFKILEGKIKSHVMPGFCGVGFIII